MIKKSRKTEAKTVYNIKYLLDPNKLNFNPVYQRGFVWKSHQERLFIETLFLDYDVPKIYLHENENEETGTTFDVVDGQQRLTTIDKFLKNEIKLPTKEDIHNDLQSVKGMLFKEVEKEDRDLAHEFLQRNLDCVILNGGYTSDDIEDMFLRYQNGEPLNAAEKRKAIPGEFRKIVAMLGKHPVFTNICGFNNKREAYQDAAAKILHIRLNGAPKSITPASIKLTYHNHSSITATHSKVQEVKSILKFITDMFSLSSNKSPKLKKYAILTLAEVVRHLKETYAASGLKAEIANAYHEFEKERIEDGELEEGKQQAKYSQYTSAARGDSPEQQKLRIETLLTHIVGKLPQMKLKAKQRSFSTYQRLAIYYKYNKQCNECSKEVEMDSFHADHITPYSKGGETTLENGQLLCVDCNLAKSDN